MQPCGEASLKKLTGVMLNGETMPSTTSRADKALSAAALVPSKVFLACVRSRQPKGATNP